MGLHDAEEMLEAAKADAIVLERQRDAALGQLEGATHLAAILSQRVVKAEKKLAAIAALEAVTYGDPYWVFRDVRRILGDDPVGVFLVPDEVPVARFALTAFLGLYANSPRRPETPTDEQFEEVLRRLESTS